MSSIGTLTIDIAANVARLQADMNAVKDQVGGAMSGISSAADFAKKAFIGLGGAMAIKGIAGLITGSIDAAGALNDLSIKTGASVESLSKFGDVGRLSGVTAEQVGDAMNKLAKNMAIGSEAAGGTMQAIRALGLDFEQFKRLSPEDQMIAAAKAMNGFADGSGKSAAAMALFGKTGAELLPFMADLANTGELQARVTAEQAAQADEFGDNLERLKLSGGALTDTLAMGMVPALADASGAFVEVFNGSGGLREQLQGLVADGTIASWTRTAVTGLTYVMDAVTGVWRTFKVLGEYIGGSVAAFAAAFSAIGGAATKAFAGDFKGAIAEAKTGVQQWNQITAEMGENISKIWSEQTMGQKIRARMADIKAAGDTSQAAKPKLDLSAPIDKTTKAAKAQSDAIKELTKVEGIEIGILKALKKEHEAQFDAVRKETDEIRKQIDEQRKANEETGLSTEALGELEVQRLRDAAATAERNALLADETLINGDIAEQYRQQAAGLRELAELKAEGVHLKAAQEAAAEWKKTSDNIFDSVSDALMRAFESGKGFGKALVDTLKNTFKTLVLQPTIQAVMAPVAGILGSLFGGTAMAGTGGGSMGIGGGLTALKAALSSNSLMAWGGGLLGGYGFGSMISGQYGSSTTTLIGTGLGAAVGGPLGALVGGVIGGVVNRLFGRGPKKITEKGIVGDVLGGEFEGQLYADWKKKGGLFRSSKRGTDYSPVDEELAATMNAAGAAVYSGVSDYAKALGLPADALATVNHHLKVRLTDDEAENQRLLEAAFAEYEAKLASTFEEALRPFQEAGESVSDTLRRLSELQVFSEALNSFGGVFSRVASLSVRAREELIGMAGGIEALLAKTQSFVENYYSDAERIGLAAQQVKAALADLGITQDINTRADFRALVEGTDISTSEGRRQLDALLSLAQVFAPIGQYLEQNGTTLSAVAEAAPQTAILESVLADSEIQSEYQQRTADAAERMNDTMLDIGDLISRAVAAMHGDVSAALASIASTSAQTARLLDRWDDGDALGTRTVT